VERTGRDLISGIPVFTGRNRGKLRETSLRIVGSLDREMNQSHPSPQYEARLPLTAPPGLVATNRKVDVGSEVLTAVVIQNPGT
jgi:hypothetical protein